VQPRPTAVHLRECHIWYLGCERNHVIVIKNESSVYNPNMCILSDWKKNNKRLVSGYLCFRHVVVKINIQ
jgi:hypothetical protein